MRSATFALLLAATTAATSQQPPSPAGGIQLHQSQAAKRDQFADDDKRGTHVSPVVVEIAPTKNAAAIADREREEEEQRVSNDKIVAYSTVALAGITAVLAFFTGWLWRSTGALVKESQDTGRRKLRAYVGIEKIAFESPSLHMRQGKHSPSGEPTGLIYRDFLAATMRNYGRTPAYEVTIHTNFTEVRDGNLVGVLKLPDGFDYRDFDSDAEMGRVRIVSKQTVQPRQSVVSRVPLKGITMLKHAMERKVTLYIHGHIDYTDIYKRRWSCCFCYLYEPWRPEAIRFTPYEEHNFEEQI